MNKEGIFEWIVSYDTIKEYFDALYLPCLLNEQDNKKKTALVIGCGTSTLSESLAKDFQFDVTAIDNDEDCVNHMNSLFPSSSVCYECYDIVERVSTTAAKVSQATANESFDLIVDKGTLDAILVEGSITTMIVDIIRLLKVNGYYMLFTINEIDLLTTMFTYSSLPFQITYAHPLKQTKNKSKSGGTSKTVGGNLMIIQKTEYPVTVFRTLVPTTTPKLTYNESIYAQESFVQELRRYEDEIMDEYFQTSQPLLTPDYEAHIRDSFASSNPPNYASLSKAHNILFGGNFHRDLGYDYSLFLEDMRTFPLQDERAMTVEEAIAFIQHMQ